MAGIDSSEQNPLFGFTREQANTQFSDGGGAPVYIDRGWYMNIGPAASVDFGATRFISSINSLTPGIRIVLDKGSYPRSPGIEPDEVAHDYYVERGKFSDEGFLFGDSSFVLRGTIELLPNGQFNVNLKGLPYDDQFGYENNGKGGWLEFFRSLGGLVAGSGEAFPIRFRGDGGRVIQGAFTGEELLKALGPVVSRGFPAHTRIQTSRTTSTAISALRVGDVVLAFDARADKGRGALVPRRVSRLYRNTTTDWLRLRWHDGTREVITTPGHHFLDAFGGFPTIEEMVKEGRAQPFLRRDRASGREGAGGLEGG